MSIRYLFAFLLTPLAILAQDFDTEKERLISFSGSLNERDRGGLEFRKQIVNRPFYFKLSGFGTNGFASARNTLLAMPEYHSDSSFALRDIETWNTTFDGRVGLEYFRKMESLRLIIGLDAIVGGSRVHYSETSTHYELNDNSSEYSIINSRSDISPLDNYNVVDYWKVGLSPAFGLGAYITPHLMCTAFIRGESFFKSPISSAKVVSGTAIDPQFLDPWSNTFNVRFYTDIGIGYRF